MILEREYPARDGRQLQLLIHIRGERDFDCDIFDAEVPVKECELALEDRRMIHAICYDVATDVWLDRADEYFEVGNDR